MSTTNGSQTNDAIDDRICLAEENGCVINIAKFVNVTDGNNVIVSVAAAIRLIDKNDQITAAPPSMTISMMQQSSTQPALMVKD